MEGPYGFSGPGSEDMIPMNETTSTSTTTMSGRTGEGGKCLLEDLLD